MLAITPASLMASDEATAMLYCKGTVLVNGNPVPGSSAISAGDSVQTAQDSVATITQTGSSVIVQPQSSVKFAGNSISLEQGVVSVASSSGLVTSAGSASATPASGTWTEYEVTNVNGMVEIISRKGSLSVNCGKENAALAEGGRVTADDSGKCNRKRAIGAYPPASGDILNSPYLKYIAAGTGVGILIWLLWPGPQKPASPAVP
jgi:hypothetical protein